jgi:hypothetical protein
LIEAFRLKDLSDENNIETAGLVGAGPGIQFVPSRGKKHWLKQMLFLYDALANEELLSFCS